LAKANLLNKGIRPQANRYLHQATDAAHKSCLVTGDAYQAQLYSPMQ
jgi:hypothetical protein